MDRGFVVFNKSWCQCLFVWSLRAVEDEQDELSVRWIDDLKEIKDKRG